MSTEAQKQHQWLNRWIGEWTWEGEYRMGSEQPLTKTSGTEIVRSLGEYWIIGEGMGGGEESSDQTIITLGYDPQKDRYVGTFVVSMMPFLWIYTGSLDPTEKILTLATEGPNFSESAITQYKDITEFISDDHRIMTSEILMDDGSWNHFMTAHYRRDRKSVV